MLCIGFSLGFIDIHLIPIDLLVFIDILLIIIAFRGFLDPQGDILQMIGTLSTDDSELNSHARVEIKLYSPAEAALSFHRSMAEHFRGRQLL